MIYTDELNRAFSRGGDARLAGLPESANPYTDPAMDAERRYWRRGYRHVHAYWGCNARPGRVIRRLPTVRPGASLAPFHACPS